MVKFCWITSFLHMTYVIWALVHCTCSHTSHIHRHTLPIITTSDSSSLSTRNQKCIFPTMFYTKSRQGTKQSAFLTLPVFWYDVKVLLLVDIPGYILCNESIEAVIKVGFLHAKGHQRTEDVQPAIVWLVPNVLRLTVESNHRFQITG